MYDILEQMEHNAVCLETKELCGDESVKAITYGKFYQLSGRVYAYLKNKGIGREDFVLICLPRGVQPLIALVGVLRCGGAFVVVEDNYAPERIAYIKEDCGCKLVLDAQCWEEIQTMEPLSGYEQRDPHDAAFAVYTSGTTGNPKGVLHEYGNIQRLLRSQVMTSCAPMTQEDDRFALVAPLNFVATVGIWVYALYWGIYVNVTSYNTVKDPMRMAMYLQKYGITGTFLTPSYIRKMTRKPPTLRFCIVGSEPANQIYLEGLQIHNFYTMSEAAFNVAHFLIDRKYDETPVGDSECGFRNYLLDENGKEVPDGEEGELCFENPYVRGYINLPEQTKEAFRGGLYHSGDLAKRDSQGRLIIKGRLNEMVKINGNRVEPGEIEGVAKKVLGTQWAAARIFDDGRKVFICVYYLDNITVDAEKVRAEMAKYLPYYMLPSFFIHIDEIPVKATGKMDRKALPAPVLENNQDDYVAPTNEVETALCSAFAKVLDRKKIGIHDDFYQMGGDSLASMDVLMEAKLPGLNATDIFRGRTPEKIAQLYAEHTDEDGDPDELNDAAMKKPHRLTTEQLYMIDYQLYTPNSTMYNLYNMLKLDKEIIDMEQMARALNAAVQNHPVFMTEFFFDEDGDICQRYRADRFREISLERVSEEELAQIKKTLVRPFRIIGGELARFRLFETEEAGYLFADMHHTIFDGTSSKVFFNSLMTAYAGQDLAKDHYYYILDKREKQESSPFYRECQEYFQEHYGHTDWCRHLTPDVKTRENTENEIFVPLPITPAQLDALTEAHDISRNGFFITAAALANAVYEKRSNILLSWIYNGRTELTELSSAGLLFRNLPVGVCFDRLDTLDALYQDVAQQITGGIAHSCYAYLERDNSVVEDDLTCVLYQDDLRNLEDAPGLLGLEELESQKQASQNIMDIEILHQGDGMTMMLDYAASRFAPENIEKYAKLYCAAVQGMVQGGMKLSELMAQMEKSIPEA